MKGHLKVLQWAQANACPWDKWTCTYSRMQGHVKIIKWARKHECPELGKALFFQKKNHLNPKKGETKKNQRRLKSQNNNYNV